MIPSLLRKKLALKYGEDFVLPKTIDKLLSNKESYQGLEHDLQKSFFKWLSIFYVNSPEYWLIHAIPNGGTRNKIEASQFKAEGVRAGIPDIFIPIPKGKYKGLYIEFKAKSNKPNEDQRIIMLMLESQGYKVICTNSFEIARDEFSYYMVS